MRELGGWESRAGRGVAGGWSYYFMRYVYYCRMRQLGGRLGGVWLVGGVNLCDWGRNHVGVDSDMFRKVLQVTHQVNFMIELGTIVVRDTIQ